VIELVGTSSDSWEKATAAAVKPRGSACATCGSRRSASWTCSSRTARSRPIAPK